MVTRAFEDTVETALERMEPVQEVGIRAARAVHGAVLRDERARGVADALHGTWLGHPLHPALTDVTIGAWVLAGAFDAAGELGGSRFARRAGDALTGFGAAAAVPTAVSGLTDYTTVPKPAGAAATIHGVLVLREGNDIYAIGAVCAHAGGPLEEGRFYDTCVQCPWHDSVFDLSDGHIVHGPATQPQPVFDARIRDGRVELKLRQG